MLVQINLLYFEVNIAFRVLRALLGLDLKPFLAFFTNQCHPRLFSDLCWEWILFLTSYNNSSRAAYWLGRNVLFFWGINKSFSFTSWMDSLVLLLSLTRFLLGSLEWPNMLACSLYVEFCRRSSRSVRELHFFSLLVTTSSSCVQRSSFTLPQTVSIFTLESSRILSSSVKCMLIVWVFSWLVLSILSI